MTVIATQPTRVDGRLRITPPLNWAEIKRDPLMVGSWRGSALTLAIKNTQVETDDGILMRKTCDTVQPIADTELKGHSIVTDVQKLLDAYPTHTFTGELDCIDTETFDRWRLVIKDGKAYRLDAQLTWHYDCLSDINKGE